MICSMTAYAQLITDSPWGNLCWEMRSVNNRYLELYFKLPEEVRELEYGLREIARQAIGRGKLECLLKLENKRLEEPEIKLNMHATRNIIAACNKISETLTNSATLSAIDILKWPGVIESNTAAQTELHLAIKKSFSEALNKLKDARQTEGSELAKIINTKLATMLQHIQQVQQQLPTILIQQKERLAAKIADMNLTLDENRLEQELVYILQKADIAEEIDRLLIHVAECKRVCATDNMVGRKLDFLLQEMNREANTLASKSVATLTSMVAIELKVLIEQIREQVQNLE
jgi:uncharacterized protein (TIGR00255 family)